MYDIGISAGTFNPIHTWHLIAAESARQQFGLSQILFIPNGNPVHKTGVLDKEDRFKLVSMACSGNRYFKASRIEIDREGPSYTIDTLRELSRRYRSRKDTRLNLIIGLDNIGPDSSLPITKWKDSEEIFSLCRVMVAPRHCELADREKIRTMLSASAEFEVIDCPTSTISSTMIRSRIREGKSVRYLLPRPVYERVMRKRFYAL